MLWLAATTHRACNLHALSRVWIARCSDCKAHQRLEAGTEVRMRNKRPSLRCACGSMMDVHLLRGSVTHHQCDDRCLTAKGFRCECSCGGANHGVSA